MQDELREAPQYNEVEPQKDKVIFIELLYNRYAPGMYGKILGMVKQKEVAEKILEKIFLTLPHNNGAKPKYVTPFCHLLNHTHKKTVTTLKAIRMLQACGCDQKGGDPLMPIDSVITNTNHGDGV